MNFSGVKFSRYLSATIIMAAALITAGCLNRSSDKSSDPYGTADFGGSLYTTGSSAPGNFFAPSYAAIDAEGVNNLVIYAVKDTDTSESEKIYPNLNPETHTFMFSSQASGNYIVAIVKGSGASKTTYRFRVYATSSYKMLFSDLQLSSSSLVANVFKINSSTPSDAPKKIACLFSSDGYVTSTASDVSGTFSSLSGSTNVVGSTSAITDAMTALTDASDTDIIVISKILTQGTGSLSGDVTLSSLTGSAITPKTGPTFTVSYGPDANFSTTTIKQGDTVYVKVTTSPVITSARIFAKIEVYDSSGSLSSTASGNKNDTSSSGVYTYDTTQVASESGFGIWSTFTKAGTVKVNLTIINNDSTSSSYGASTTKTETITVASTATTVVTASTAPTINGAAGTSEWSSTSLVITDSTSDGAVSGTDIYKVYASKDSTYLYLRMDLNTGNDFLTDGTTYAFRIGVDKNSTESMDVMKKGDFDVRVSYDSDWEITLAADSGQTAVTATGATCDVDTILECRIALADLKLGSGAVAHVGAYVFSGASFAAASDAKDATATILLGF